MALADDLIPPPVAEANATLVVGAVNALHAADLTPEELTALVERVKALEAALREIARGKVDDGEWCEGCKDWAGASDLSEEDYCGKCQYARFATAALEVKP